MNRIPRLPTLLLFLSACTGSTPDDGLVVPVPTLELEHSGASLTELASEAVVLAPRWLQNDLSLNFIKLNETTQDVLGALIVDLDSPWIIDEVAFTVAHLSPELLEHEDFYPQILVENAEMIYEQDLELAYVELIDEGEPGVDEDYWTMARYRIENEAGETIEQDIDPDVYYWYLVHPRMEDEYPFYIDGWAACSGAECASSPEEGQFWREFLWEGALDDCPDDRECPVIKDYVANESVDLMWKSKAYNRDDNGAVGALINWEIDAISFGAGEERPIQPNRIYAVGCGNCGEWADMATAAARTALIPSQNVGARANDHTWNEFWDDGWMQWEPVNTYVGHWTYYQSSEGETSDSNAVYAITSSRGDGLVETHRTVDYGNTFELTVEVLDTHGYPVDGAVVALFGPILVYPDYEDYWWYAAEGTTDANGLATMTLGENNAWALRVDAPIGSNPEKQDYILPFLETSTAGQDEFMTVTLEDSEMPSLDMTEIEAPEEGELQLSFSINLEHRLAANSYMLRGSFSAAIEDGLVQRFVVDSDNYALFSAGDAFEAFASQTGLSADTGVITIPSDEDYYLVLSNERSTAISSMGTIIAVLSSEETEWEDGIDAVSIEESFILLPGEHLSVALQP